MVAPAAYLLHTDPFVRLIGATSQKEKTKSRETRPRLGPQDMARVKGSSLSPEGSRDTELVGDVGGLQESSGPGPLGHHVAGAEAGGDRAAGRREVLRLCVRKLPEIMLHAMRFPFFQTRRKRKANLAPGICLYCL
jgi:hypothetical protein